MSNQTELQRLKAEMDAADAAFGAARMAERKAAQVAWAAERAAREAWVAAWKAAWEAERAARVAWEAEGEK